MPWYNVFHHPRADNPNGEFDGRAHPTKEEADEAAAYELSVEPETTLVRQERRDC